MSSYFRTPKSPRKDSASFSLDKNESEEGLVFDKNKKELPYLKDNSFCLE